MKGEREGEVEGREEKGQRENEIEKYEVKLMDKHESCAYQSCQSSLHTFFLSMTMLP